VNTEDGAVAKLLRMLTFLSAEEIAALEVRTTREPEARAAQQALGRELTRLVHGPAALEAAVKASAILFGGPLDEVPLDVFGEVVGEVPTARLDPAALAGRGAPVGDLFVQAGLCPSKSQARRDLEAGGLYLNNVRATDATRSVTGADLLFGRYLLLRKGKRSYAVLAIQ
jgi:tyrosyl-tRNA synthetase